VFDANILLRKKGKRKGKGKFVPVPVLPKHHAMTTYVGVKV
jgi:hypothetical protein